LALLCAGPAFAEPLIDPAFSNAKDIEGRPPSTSYVAFTFDDGPHYKTTPRVLKVLAEHQVVATFFVVGSRFIGGSRATKKNAALLQEIIAQGHDVGNHTFRHQNLKKSTHETIAETIETTRDAIVSVLGRHTALFRAPYGARSPALRDYLRENGYTHVFWDIDSRDYLTKNPRTLRKRVTKAIIANRGGVVLFHDTKVVTVKALPGILDDLEAENCARLDNDKPLIVPVSLHFMVREDNGEMRPIAPEVRERSERYQNSLPERCEQRKNRKRPPRFANAPGDFGPISDRLAPP
jgi:peptidoglycan/xylan/chitin deacetylase (PgdA/CDA1 family)